MQKLLYVIGVAMIGLAVYIQKDKELHFIPTPGQVSQKLISSDVIKSGNSIMDGDSKLK
jgi:hypothetical protein